MSTVGGEFASIVLIGNFNPSIFHREWFVSNDIISRTEFEEENQEAVTSYPITKVILSWGIIQITPNQFIIRGTNPAFFGMLNDLVQKTFGILSHTPLAQIGINYEEQLLTKNIDEQRSFGIKVAPLNNWDFMRNPGMRDFIMEDQERPDEYRGYIQARIQSPRTVKNSVSLSINDHYEINYEEGSGATEIINILELNWDKSMERSRLLISTIKEKFK